MAAAYQFLVWGLFHGFWLIVEARGREVFA